MVDKLENKMHHISERRNKFTVRIARDGQIHQAVFPDQPSAICWRDSKLDELGKTLINGPATKGNKSTGIRGVSEYEIEDKRSGDFYGGFSMSYREDGKSKSKQFKYGNLENLDTSLRELAMKAAISCRKCYQDCVELGTNFDHTDFNDWRGGHV